MYYNIIGYVCSYGGVSLKHERSSKTSLSRRAAKPAKRSKKADDRSATGFKRASEAELEKKSGRKSKKRHHRFAVAGTVLAIALCIGLVIVIGIFSGIYAAVSKEIDEMDFDGIAYNFSSTIFATNRDGTSHKVVELRSDGNREWIDSKNIPEIAKIAAVSIEDERFYQHNGIDIKRTIGAALGWAKSKISNSSLGYGGSTITQQVIKNITNEKDKTAMRKIKEMMRAIALEKRYTKDEILTMYLNIVYFGNQCYGIEAASKVYFSKSAIDLTLPEAAMIVGITQAPSRYDPFRNPEETLKKRNTVLSKMYELGKITEEEYEQAKNSELGVNGKYVSPKSAIYNYFVDQVINDVIDALQKEKGYSKEFATQQMFNGGLKIYTTMDSDIQTAMENVYKDKSNFPAADKGTQSAMTVIDPYTGEIKGMVGGIGAKTESRGLNRATQSKRQPGSSIKPLSVYSPALETGGITAATVLNDEKITIGKWTPKNSYKGFKGKMSVRKAIEISANVPAVRTLVDHVGLDTSYDFLTKKYHLASIVPEDKNYSPLSLGGLTKGVSTKEMAAAYSVFVNNGVYNEPHTYTKVLDSAGKVLLEYTPKSNRVLSEGNAFIMTSFLYEVVNGSAGTGRSARLSNMPTYGKTGTTNSNHDKWFVGFTPYYVGAVWYGYDNKSQGVSTNASVAVWKKVMAEVHKGLELKQIPVPENVVALGVCQRTGKLASKGCGRSHAEYFVSGTEPKKYCGGSCRVAEPIATETPAESEGGSEAGEGGNASEAGGGGGGAEAESGGGSESGGGGGDSSSSSDDNPPSVFIAPDSNDTPQDSGGSVMLN